MYSNRNKDNMTSSRWAYLKALKVPAPRWFHVSKWFNEKEVTSPAGIKSVIFIEDLESPRTFKRPTTPTITISEGARL